MTHDETPSSDDDGLDRSGAAGAGTDGAAEVSEPWWANHPVIAAKRREVEEWLESIEAMEPVPLHDDSLEAIHRQISTGECRQELREARRDLDRARVRYADAIRTARAVGYSWGEIGELVGVARQLLHRRFRYEVD
jgi:hypothetical protein